MIVDAHTHILTGQAPERSLLSAPAKLAHLRGLGL